MREPSARPMGASGGAMPASIGDDLMRGADELRVFIFGDAEDERQAESDRRSVYHLAAKGELGLFKLGGVLCGRKSTILAHLAQLEGSRGGQGG